MLAWWHWAGIDHIDLAVKRLDTMAWHCDLAAYDLPLAWARAQNVRHADVYARPARGRAWPLVFLDDVAVPRAQAIARKYEALVVETSHAGGCHVWLACSGSLTEAQRLQAQRWLAQKLGADLGSVSGEHLGRLAGFKNWKRNGVWVNVLEASRHGQRWDPGDVPATGRTRSETPGCRHGARDTSPSGREWGWVCGQLEAGVDPDLVYNRLLATAHRRRGSDAPRYARRTVERALLKIGTPKEVEMKTR